MMPPGGMPPMAGGMPGMPPPGGMPGMPPPPPGPDPGMQALQGLSGVPAPGREKKAMAEASAQIQIALTGIYGRSAKAAEHLSKAYEHIQKARQVMEELAQAPVGPPPDLLGGMQGMSQGPPSGPML